MRLLFGLGLGALIAAAAVMQAASDGVLGGVAAAGSLPHVLNARAGEAADLPMRGLVERVIAHNAGTDVLRMRAHVEQLDAAGDYRGADKLESSIVTRLQHGGDRILLADALWRLGQLDAEVGYREPPHRRREWQKALQEYRGALELEPFSETIVLAAANQALLDGERDMARRYFARALSLDPASAAAKDGLQRAQTGAGVPPPFVAPAEWNR